MPNCGKQYVVTVFKIWGKHIAGPVFAVLSLVIPLISLAITDPGRLAAFLKWAPIGTAILAVLFVFVAGFGAWSDERIKFETERAKNSLPELFGEISRFRQDGPSGTGSWREPDPNVKGGFRQHRHADIQIAFDLYVCNRRQTRTTMRQLLLDGSKLQPPVTFTVSALPSQILEQGVGYDAPIKCDVVVDGFDWTELTERVDLGRLEVTLVDSFGGGHPIAVRAGERLPTG